MKYKKNERKASKMFFEDNSPTSLHENPLEKPTVSNTISLTLFKDYLFIVNETL